jgi:hypothetical protein
MAKSQPKSDPKTDHRQARLAEALRENLRRRKAHTRQTEGGESSPSGTGESTGENNPSADTAKRRNPAAKSL